MQHKDNLINKFFDKKIQERFADYILSKRLLDPYFSHIKNLFQTHPFVMQHLHDYCMPNKKNKTRYELSSTTLIRNRIFVNLEVQIGDLVVKEYAQTPSSLLPHIIPVTMHNLHNNVFIDEFCIVFENLIKRHFRNPEDTERFTRCAKRMREMFESVIEDCFFEDKKAMQPYSQIMIKIENSIEYEKHHFDIKLNKLKSIFPDEKNETEELHRIYIRQFFISAIGFHLSKTIQHAYAEKMNLAERKKRIENFMARKVADYFISSFENIENFITQDKRISQIIYDNLVTNDEKNTIFSDKIRIRGKLFRDLSIRINDTNFCERQTQGPVKITIGMDSEKTPFHDDEFEELFFDDFYLKLLTHHFYSIYKNNIIDKINISTEILFLEDIIAQCFTLIDLEMSKHSLSSVIKIMEHDINADNTNIETIRENLKTYFITSMAIHFSEIINDLKNFNTYKMKLLNSLDKKRIREFCIEHQVLNYFAINLSSYSMNDEKIMQAIYERFVSEEEKTIVGDKNISVDGKLFFDLSIKINQNTYVQSMDSKSKSHEEKPVVNFFPLPFLNKQFEDIFINCTYEKIKILNNNPIYKNRINEDELLVLFLEKALSETLTIYDGTKLVYQDPVSLLVSKLKIKAEDEEKARKDMAKYFTHSMAIYLAENIKNLYKEKIVSLIMEEPKTRAKKNRPTLFIPIADIDKDKILEERLAGSGSASDRTDRTASPPKSADRGSSSNSSRQSPGRHSPLAKRRLSGSHLSHHRPTSTSSAASGSTITSTTSSISNTSASSAFTKSDGGSSYTRSTKK